MKKSDQLGELAAALSKAQGEISAAIKDTTNPFFKSKYADLAEVWSVIRGPFTKYGLSVSQGMEGDSLTTLLMHSSGQWIESSTLLLYEKNTPQGLGSAITYNRRYALSAIAGVVQEDDDGESAMVRSQSKTNVKTPVLPRNAQDREEVNKVDSVREALNKSIMSLYGPFMKAHEGFIMSGHLLNKYGVNETRLMTTEQLTHLVKFMESEMNPEVGKVKSGKILPKKLNPSFFDDDLKL